MNKGKVTLGKRLHKWRTAKGLTQREAAERLGVNVRTYENWEQDHRVPAALAALLGEHAEAYAKLRKVLQV